MFIALAKTMATVPNKALSLIGNLEKGQASQISEDEVLAYKDLPTKAYDLGAILRHGISYELIDFLARLQVVAMARLADEHAEKQMIQRALAGELKSDEEPALQKIGRKRQNKSNRLLIKFPELNTSMVEAFQELDKTTRATKDMALNNKHAQK